MNNGNKDERPLERLAEQPEDNVPPAYLAYARWLLQNPQVLEVWSVVSDLPEITTPNAGVTLDAGTWFLCRVEMPPTPDGIISFVPDDGHGRV